MLQCIAIAKEQIRIRDSLSSTQEQIKSATDIVRQMEKQKYENKVILTRSEVIAMDGRMTKHHFKKIKARMMSSIMDSIKDPNTGVIATTQAQQLSLHALRGLSL